MARGGAVSGGAPEAGSSTEREAFEHELARRRFEFEIELRLQREAFEHEQRSLAEQRARMREQQAEIEQMRRRMRAEMGADRAESDTPATARDTGTPSRSGPRHRPAPLATPRRTPPPGARRRRG